MTNFSYATAFTNVADIGKVGKDFDDFQRYMILVGDDDCEKTFLHSGNFICAEPFTTYADAKAALELVKDILAVVDEHIAHGLNLADVRDECIAGINHATSGNLITKRKAKQAVNDVCSYYLSHSA